MLFNQDGLCGYDEFCCLIGVVDLQVMFGMIQLFEYDNNNDDNVNQLFVGYVQNVEGVCIKFRGLMFNVCSEWDLLYNDDCYKGLNELDGFFGKQKDINLDGYVLFIKFFGNFQFLDKLLFELLLVNQKFWYFYLFEFIWYFRKCGWFSKKEMFQFILDCVIRKFGLYNLFFQGVWELLNLDYVLFLFDRFGLGLNNLMRKFKFDIFG